MSWLLVGDVGCLHVFTNSALKQKVPAQRAPRERTDYIKYNVSLKETDMTRQVLKRDLNYPLGKLIWQILVNEVDAQKSVNSGTKTEIFTETYNPKNTSMLPTNEIEKIC